LLRETELEQYLVDHEPAVLPERMTRVDDVQQQIGVARLLECRSE